MRPGDSLASGRPFLVAHRAANDLARLRAAEAAGARVVEADVYLHRERLEVRHLRTAGPLPVLWDRWRLANPFAPRLLLPELLSVLSPATSLVLDLKGRDPRLPEAVGTLLDGAPVSDVTVCARAWRFLESFEGHPRARPVYSVGYRHQLRALHRRHGRSEIAGVTIHAGLLDRTVVRDLRSYAALVMTWPVNTLEQARRLLDWEVDGLITDRLDLVAGALAGRPAPSPAL